MNVSNLTNRIRYLLRKYGVQKTIERIFVYFFFKLQYPYNKYRVSGQEDLPRVTYVDPKKIQYSTIPRGVFPTSGDKAIVGKLGGVWDRFQMDVEDMVLYRSLKERFENGIQWEETEMYRLACWAIEHGMFEYNSRSKSELQEYCRSLDALFESIQKNGYVERSANVTKKDAYGDISTDDEVTVIGDYVVPNEPRVGCTREGEYIRLGGGKHRIVLSQLLDIDAIPVIIVIEHEKCNTHGN